MDDPIGMYIGGVWRLAKGWHNRGHGCVDPATEEEVGSYPWRRRRISMMRSKRRAVALLSGAKWR